MSEKQLDLSEELGRLGLPEAAVVVNAHVWYQDLYGVRSVFVDLTPFYTYPLKDETQHRFCAVQLVESELALAKEVCDAFDIHSRKFSRIRKRFQQGGIAALVLQTPGRKSERTPQIVQAIVQLYQQGDNTYQVAAKVGRSASTVTRILKDQGVPLRSSPTSQLALFDQPVEGSDDRESHAIQDSEVIDPVTNPVIDPDGSCDLFSREWETTSVAVQGIVQAEPVADEPTHEEENDTPLSVVSLVALQQAANEAETRMNWQLKARLAVLALHFGDQRIAEGMCEIQNRPDPIERTKFIKEVQTWHGDLQHLADELLKIDHDASPALRSGLCLAVGSIPLDQLQSLKVKQKWVNIFSSYLDQPDTGAHSAAGWALRNWDEELETTIKPSTDSAGGRNWSHNSVGMAMLKIPPSKTIHPSQDFIDQDEVGHLVVAQPFWLADREVSVQMFITFMDDSDPSVEKPIDWRPDARYGHHSTKNEPVSKILWNDAVLFCNWLSKREGLTPCYERAGETEEFKRARGNVRTVTRQEEEVIITDVWRFHPTADGYRLPTDSEWVHACRSGTNTDYPCGDEQHLWDNGEFLFYDYAVCRQGQKEDCGSKLPNGWGSSICTVTSPSGASRQAISSRAPTFVAGPALSALNPLAHGQLANCSIILGRAGQSTASVWREISAPSFTTMPLFVGPCCSIRSKPGLTSIPGSLASRVRRAVSDGVPTVVVVRARFPRIRL